MRKEKVSVIGCGWLGLPLAKHLISKGYEVKGSTTSKAKISDLEDVGVEAFHIILNENGIDGPIDEFLSESEILIINIPPRLRKNPNRKHYEEIQQLLSAVKQSVVKHILFVGSISVFKDASHFPIITSDTPPNGTSSAAVQLIKIETLIKNQIGTQHSIIRLAGLIDDQRHPGNILAGKTNIPNGKAPLNLVHKEDCINCISEILGQQAWGYELNLSYPYHPQKQDYYSNFSKTHELKNPEFNTSIISKGKIIDSRFVEQLLQFDFCQKP